MSSFLQESSLFLHILIFFCVDQSTGGGGRCRFAWSRRDYRPVTKKYELLVTPTSLLHWMQFIFSSLWVIGRLLSIFFFFTVKSKEKATKRKPSKGTTMLLSVPDYMWILKATCELSWEGTLLNLYLLWCLFFIQLEWRLFLHLSFGLCKLHLKLILFLLHRGLSAAGRSGLCCSTGRLIVRHFTQEEENCQEGHNSRQYVEPLLSVSHCILHHVVVVL